MISWVMPKICCLPLISERLGKILTSPPLAIPPRCPYLSMSTVLAPLLAALMAEATPPGPPPTTTTSASRHIFVLRLGSVIGFTEGLLGIIDLPTQGGSCLLPL